MSLKQNFELMASYNQWMNEKIYKVASNLDEAALKEDRRAFFGSVLGTLNHITVADRMWLKRFATHSGSLSALSRVAKLPSPVSLDQVMFGEFDKLHAHRKWLDEQIIYWISELAEGDFSHILSYCNSKGVPSNRRFSALILHFFNHQTHHRGQLSTLLFQAGQDPGVTDLLALISEEADDF